MAMQLRPGDIERFQKLWLSRFGEELSSDDARSKLAMLVRQVQLVYRPITNRQYEKSRGV
jgi:hypothetical protein